MDVMQKSFRPGDCLIHGGARGVDSWAEEAARSAGVPVSRSPADWDRYGKPAGMLRNSAMLHDTLAAPSYLIVIFWDGQAPSR